MAQQPDELDLDEVHARLSDASAVLGRVSNVRRDLSTARKGIEGGQSELDGMVAELDCALRRLRGHLGGDPVPPGQGWLPPDTRCAMVDQLKAAVGRSSTAEPGARPPLNGTITPPHGPRSPSHASLPLAAAAVVVVSRLWQPTMRRTWAIRATPKVPSGKPLMTNSY